MSAVPRSDGPNAIPDVGYIHMLKEQRRLGESLDLKLIVADGKSFMVHKQLVTKFSKLIQTKLDDDDDDDKDYDDCMNIDVRSETSVVELPMITSDGLVPVLEQMYSTPGEWRIEEHVDMENVLDVIKAGRFLGMKTDIVEKSELFLQRNLNARNVVGMMKKAERYRSAEMEKAVTDVNFCMRQCLVHTIFHVIECGPGDSEGEYDRSLLFTHDELLKYKPLQYLKDVCLCTVPLNVQLRGLVKMGNVTFLQQLRNWNKIEPQTIDCAIKLCGGTNATGPSADVHTVQFLKHMRDRLSQYNNEDVCGRVVLQIQDERLRDNNHFENLAMVIRCKETGRCQVQFKGSCYYWEKCYGYSDSDTYRDVPFSEEEATDFIAIHGFLLCRSKSGKHCHILDTTRTTQWHRLCGPENSLHAMSNMVNVGTRVFVAGRTPSEDNDGDSSDGFFVHMFSFEEQKWSVLCPIPKITESAKLLVWNDKIYLLGVLEEVTSQQKDDNEMGEEELSQFWGFVQIDPETAELRRLDSCPRSLAVQKLTEKQYSGSSSGSECGSGSGSSIVDISKCVQDLIPNAKMFITGNTLYTDLDVCYDLCSGQWVSTDRQDIQDIMANKEFCCTVVDNDDDGKEFIVTVGEKNYAGLSDIRMKCMQTYSMVNGKFVPNGPLNIFDLNFDENNKFTSNLNERYSFSYYPMKLPAYTYHS